MTVITNTLCFELDQQLKGYGQYEFDYTPHPNAIQVRIRTMIGSQSWILSGVKGFCFQFGNERGQLSNSNAPLINGERVDLLFDLTTGQGIGEFNITSKNRVFFDQGCFVRPYYEDHGKLSLIAPSGEGAIGEFTGGQVFFVFEETLSK